MTALADELRVVVAEWREIAASRDGASDISRAMAGIYSTFADQIDTLLRAHAVELGDALRERDALRELLHTGQWVREEGATFLMIELRPGADLSCKAARDAAIDTAIGQAEGAGNG